jgi:hypothetical protein
VWRQSDVAGVSGFLPGRNHPAANGAVVIVVSLRLD